MLFDVIILNILTFDAYHFDRKITSYSRLLFQGSKVCVSVRECEHNGML